jgi:hypothetical protein
LKLQIRAPNAANTLKKLYTIKPEGTQAAAPEPHILPCKGEFAAHSPIVRRHREIEPLVAEAGDLANMFVPLGFI